MHLKSIRISKLLHFHTKKLRFFTQNDKQATLDGTTGEFDENVKKSTNIV